jgi:Methylamine utilisation protein MauE
MTTLALWQATVADVRDVQPPALALLLIGGCLAKLARMIRTRSLDGGLGPTQLFPPRARRPLAVALCAVEGSLGVALTVTLLPVSTHPGAGLFAPRAATGARVAAAALFLVAVAALTEVRGRQPSLGCGCFGDLSTRPPGVRSVARAAVLTMSALVSLGSGPLYVPMPGHGALLALGVAIAELALLAALSPETGEALARLGYRDPCEFRTLPPRQTLAALHRSPVWQRYCDGIGGGPPSDMWRELCWRYLVFAYQPPWQATGAGADVVFAVEMKRRRPAVHAVVVPRVPGRPRPRPVAFSGPLPESSLSARKANNPGETRGPGTQPPGITLAGRAGSGRNAAQ